jgi:hypothetical protein
LKLCARLGSATRDAALQEPHEFEYLMEQFLAVARSLAPGARGAQSEEVQEGSDWDVRAERAREANKAKRLQDGLQASPIHL